MRVRVAFKKHKRIHERDMWIVTVFDTPADIMRYAKRAIEQMQQNNKIPMNTQTPTINFAPVIAINTDSKETPSFIGETPNTDLMTMPGIKFKTPTEAPIRPISDKELFSGGLVIKKSG